ncbi:MAG: hypothetical protein LC113_09920 [Acidobacteria bacterium]|nr:hypothetical protein [Acidobacteriota bacterium]
MRKRNEELMILVEKLAFEIKRLRENEAFEREKLLLQLELEKQGKKKPKALSKKKK